MWLVTRTDRASERAQGGFTLLEILVAMALFAIASLIAYSGLNAVISTKGSLDREIRFWRELGQVFDRMEMDFVQILPHAFRAEQGNISPPLQGNSTGSTGFFIELSRHDEDRTPVHAAYRCGNRLLNLSLEPITGRPPVTGSSTPSIPVHTLLENVEQCDVAFLDLDNSWLSAWPGKQTGLKPKAIRIRLTLAGRGQFERLYYLP